MDGIEADLSSASDQQERGGTSGPPWPGTARCRSSPHVVDGHHALKYHRLCFPVEATDSVPAQGKAGTDRAV